MDTYRDFAELSQHQREGTDYRTTIENAVDSQTVILAPHGGGIEPGTSEIARAIAGDDLSFAAFEGLKPRDNAILHITSTNFDEPRCVALVQQCRHVLTIHGEATDGAVVYVGGKDTGLRETLFETVKEAGFVVKKHDNPALQGTNPRNICNRGLTGRGAQLELSRGLRRKLFRSLSAAGRREPTAELTRFAEVVRRALKQAGAR